MAGFSLETKLKAFKEKINADYKGDVLRFGADTKANLASKRFSSQILSYDLALGGGIPFGKILIDAGQESTGKTVKCIKACVSVKDYDHNTRQHKDFFEGEKEKLFVPGRALYVDQEGAWDEIWAEKLGFDHSWHMMAQPEHAEQTIDIVNYAIRENIFDLIVIDSIAAMIPSTELEESAEDWQMGLQARLVNKAMRKWVASLNKLNQTYKGGGPTLYCLNQFRLKIGVVYGDPRVMPAGQAQRFAASIISYTNSAKVEDGKDKETEFVILGGECKKNKTYIPKLEYEFALRLKNAGDAKAGEIDNEKELFEQGKKYKLIKKEGLKVTFDDVSSPDEKTFINRLKVAPVLKKRLWRSIIYAATGCRI